MIWVQLVVGLFVVGVSVWAFMVALKSAEVGRRIGRLYQLSWALGMICLGISCIFWKIKGVHGLFFALALAFLIVAFLGYCSGGKEVEVKEKEKEKEPSEVEVE